MNNFRMLIIELLLRVQLCLVPDNKDGEAFLRAVSGYLRAIGYLSTNNKANNQ